MSRLKTRLTLAIALLALTGTSLVPVLARDDHKGREDKIGNVIDFLKSYPVSKILPGLTNVPHRKLPEIPLEKWLGSVMGDTPLEWKGGNCAAHDSDADGCVSFRVTVGTPKGRCPSVELQFIVGKDATVYLMYNGSAVNDFGVSRSSLEQLADLERKLREAKAGPVRPSSLTIDRLRARKGTDIIQYVRGLDVHRLDPLLPSERFDKWLERITDWQFQWSITDWGFIPCSFNELHVHGFSVKDDVGGKFVPPFSDVGGKFAPPFSIGVSLGSWEEEFKSEPKLTITFYGKYNEINMNNESEQIKSLSALKNKMDAWKVASYSMLPAHKPERPAYRPTLPVVQNMIPLGVFSRMRTTPTWHCYGHTLSLWKYGERVFGTHHDIGGQCADGREPTYVIRDVKFDPKTGKLEFWSYGTPGYKFVGKMDQNMVIGEFLGMSEEVKLKSSEDHAAPLHDSDKNVEVWCKGFAPKLRYIVVEELEKLCKSMGVE